MLYIQNEDQQKFIQNMVYHNIHEYKPVWLGLHDVSQEERWQWLSGLS